MQEFCSRISARHLIPSHRLTTQQIDQTWTASLNLPVDHQLAYWQKAAGEVGKVHTKNLDHQQVGPLKLPAAFLANSAVESFKFLGTTIKDLKWDSNISSIIKRTQQRIYFLCQLRKFNLPHELIVLFNSAIIESVITTSITVWGSSATKHDIHRLQCIIRSAEKTTGVKLPTLLYLLTSRIR
ncbi:hypothetical protein P4O66_020698, partial [Electrophorus voltai]